MKKLRPDYTAPAWPRSTALERLEDCRIMLRVHGMLTRAEDERVKQRIDKWSEAEESRWARSNKTGGIA